MDLRVVDPGLVGCLFTYMPVVAIGVVHDYPAYQITRLRVFTSFLHDVLVALVHIQEQEHAI